MRQSCEITLHSAICLVQSPDLGVLLADYLSDLCHVESLGGI